MGPKASQDAKFGRHQIEEMRRAFVERNRTCHMWRAELVFADSLLY